MMKEIVKANLETEMDLILANKRTMKLAEMCGLSMTIQTALATAVSEIARCALSQGSNSFLTLGILTLSQTKKQVTATVCGTTQACANTEAISFAKKLITEVAVVKNKSLYDIQLNQDLKFSGLITENKIESFIQYFNTEPPLSPYDEIRKKNIQLLEISNKLKESENQYRALAETLPIMMFVVNATGQIIYTNEWLMGYFGSSLKALTTFAWQEFVHPDDYVAIHKDLEKIFKSSNSYSTQARLKHKKNATYLWHLISIVPVKNEQGIITQWTGFFVDINPQKQVEETLKDNVELKDTQQKLIEYQKLLEEKISELNISNHELEQFAYIASHDLQEPLRKIIIFSNLLGDRLKNLDADSRAYFAKIISSSVRMTDLINDVLDWSRVSRTQEEFSAVDLNGIIETVKSDFDILLQQKHAVVLSSMLPVIKGIPMQLQQLFTNLISNAIKFCIEKPIIKITSRSLPEKEIKSNNKLDSSIEYTEITLSDNGIGFEQEYAEKIFKIFQRLHGRSEYAGTGIGLAICKKIVENHHGSISAAGNKEGATFIITLPS